MSAIEQFETWYDKLSTKEQKDLLGHILSSKLSIVTEGFHTGPFGDILARGYYSGPAGQSQSISCPYCGKQIG